MVGSQPTVTIGIPVYNGGKYLAETLRSIADQTFQDYEVVISDNGSTDETEQISRAFVSGDQRIRYFRNPTNLGVSRNFRRSFEHARGRYFKWAAGDDLLHRDYLSACVDVLDSEPGVVVCSSRMPYIEREGLLVPYDEGSGGYVTSYGEGLEWLETPPGLDSDRSVDRFKEIVMSVRSNVAAEFIYGTARKAALDRVMPLGLYLGAEKVLLAELSLMGRFFRVERDLLFRRMHPGHHGGQPWREISKGYDPQWSGWIAFPAARQLRGYAQAVFRSSVPTLDKVRCFCLLARKVLAPQSLSKLVIPGQTNYLGIGRKKET